jgi:hypothetical protein
MEKDSMNIVLKMKFPIVSQLPRHSKMTAQGDVPYKDTPDILADRSGPIAGHA